ncbi:MAG: nodulation protein NfeD [Gammaproteobacteria bacterium]|nr:nodulation protein NfeD [Gammaproteobacteria bacterium]
MKAMLTTLLAGLASVLLPLAAGQALADAGEASAGTALRLEIRGAIGPATSDYIVRGIEAAEATGARLVIIEMDTPGGLDAAMRDINKAILASSVPVATFVSPAGSRAASAGTYILYASHLAVMSPTTNLGAATPVQIGGGDTGGSPAPAAPADGEEQATPSGSAMERKVTNDAVAYIRGLATLRQRNADWAERAVREAVSLTAEAALQEGVIDFMAPDAAALLATAHGRKLVAGGQEITLDTRALQVVHHDPDWRTRLLATITDPSVAYMLLLAGIYGLVLEGYNPGSLLPGVVGAICLLLALFAFQVLPVNFTGLGLIALGVMLLVAEALTPSFGVLGLGGIAAFVFGSILLLDSEVPGFTISRGLIGSFGAIAGTGLLGLMLVLARVHRRPVVSGREALLGATAEALEDFVDGAGTVLVEGERWTARCRHAVHKGDELRITGMRGLLLDAEPLDAGHPHR